MLAFTPQEKHLGLNGMCPIGVCEMKALGNLETLSKTGKRAAFANLTLQRALLIPQNQ